MGRQEQVQTMLKVPQQVQLLRTVDHCPNPLMQELQRDWLELHLGQR